MTETDIVIIGAGAAGIGAALELQTRGVHFEILEAAARVGGRAFTDTASLPVAWDQGCHWLHSADVNPLVAHAERLGADFRRQVRVDHFAYHRAGRFVGLDERREAGAALDAAFEAIDASAARGENFSITDVLPPGGPWAGGIRCVMTLMSGDDPEKVSAAGYADYVDTHVNWPVFSGYGDLIARMATGLPVRLATPVTAIVERPGGVRVETQAGAIEAKAAIVTASTNVLASGAIRLGPGPARDLLDRIADVPCGAYEKVAFALKALPAEVAGKLFCMVDPGDGPAVDFQIAPTDPPMMIAHMAGDLARGLAAAGPEATIAFARERLVSAFGKEIENDILASATSRWTRDPFVLGSYSHAKPGRAAARRAMIEADTGPIAFAGEAFSLTGQATAHGAFESGIAAARRVARFVSARQPAD